MKITLVEKIHLLFLYVKAKKYFHFTHGFSWQFSAPVYDNSKKSSANYSLCRKVINATRKIL